MTRQMTTASEVRGQRRGRAKERRERREKRDDVDVVHINISLNFCFSDGFISIVFYPNARERVGGLERERNRQASTHR